MKIYLKKVLIAGYCYGVLPMAFVERCFAAFKLRGL